jgi:hypothetical protein
MALLGDPHEKTGRALRAWFVYRGHAAILIVVKKDVGLDFHKFMV